jgi:hypothetical protein
MDNLRLPGFHLGTRRCDALMDKLSLGGLPQGDAVRRLPSLDDPHPSPAANSISIAPTPADWTRRRPRFRYHHRWYEAHLLCGGVLRLGPKGPSPSEQQRARNAVSSRRRRNLARRL